MSNANIAAEFVAALQPVYAQVLRAHGIATGDIEPWTSERLEAAQDELAAVVSDWITDTLAMKKEDGS